MARREKLLGGEVKLQWMPTTWHIRVPRALQRKCFRQSLVVFDFVRFRVSHKLERADYSRTCTKCTRLYRCPYLAPIGYPHFCSIRVKYAVPSIDDIGCSTTVSYILPCSRSRRRSPALTYDNCTAELDSRTRWMTWPTRVTRKLVVRGPDRVDTLCRNCFSMSWNIELFLLSRQRRSCLVVWVTIT